MPASDQDNSRADLVASRKRNNLGALAVAVIGAAYMWALAFKLVLVPDGSCMMV